MASDFARYRKAKRKFGGRLDETPSSETTSSSLWGWVIVACLAVLASYTWYYAYPGYNSLARISGGGAGSYQMARASEGGEYQPTHAGMLLRERKPHELAVVFLDVGQGDSILLQTPTGKNILIDVGTGTEKAFAVQQAQDSWNRFVKPFLKKNGIDKIDIFVSSHPHSDHMGAAPDMIGDIPVGKVWISGFKNPAAGLQESMLKKIEQEGIPLNQPKGSGGTLEQGQKVDWGPAIDAWLLRTAPDGGPHKDTNDASLTFLVYYGETSILLPGDTEKAGENELIKNWGTQLNVDIYKASHHCSKTSSTPEFVYFLKPKHSVCMVGYYNTFGHPVPEVVSRLEEFGEVHSTEQSGTIYMFLDGEDIRIRKQPDYGVSR